MATNTDDGPAGGGLRDEPGPEDSGLSDQYVDLPQLVARRVAAAAGDLVAAACAHPLAAAGIVAGGVGVMIGLSVARRPPSPAMKLGDAMERRAPTQKGLADVGRKSGKRLRRAASYGELIPLAVKLFENPIVRGFVVRTVTKQVARRLK